MAGKRTSNRSLALRALIALAALGVIAFAVEGGEWGTADLMRQQRSIDRLKHAVDSLQHEVDSLVRYKKAVESDPITQERIAREEFGMVRGNKELIYRFTTPDSAVGAGKKR